MTIEERLEALEKELYGRKRRTRWMIAGGAIFVAGAFFLGGMLGKSAQADAVKSNVTAKEFVLVDKNGTRRAVLGMGGVGLAGSTVSLSMNNNKGEMRLDLLVTADGIPMLEMVDAQKRVRLGLMVTSWGVPVLRAFDAHGEAIWVAGEKVAKNE